MFKYQLGQTVFYMHDNNICSNMIKKRYYSDSYDGDGELDVRITYTINDKVGTLKYEYLLFVSAEDLINHLLKIGEIK
jgi:hypothetical protein